MRLRPPRHEPVRGPVWYLLASDEGQGFAKKKNQDFQVCATVAFVRAHLLNQAGQGPQRRRGPRLTNDFSSSREPSSRSRKRTATPRGWSVDSCSASDVLTTSARSRTSRAGRSSRRARGEVGAGDAQVGEAHDVGTLADHEDGAPPER
jgi:hypothetical protein